MRKLASGLAMPVLKRGSLTKVAVGGWDVKMMASIRLSQKLSGGCRMPAVACGLCKCFGAIADSKEPFADMNRHGSESSDIRY